MKTVLLDTTLASFVHRERPELELYEDDLRGVRVSVSFQTVAELLYGARAANWGKDRTSRLRAFTRGLKVHGYDFGLAKAWALVMDEAKKQGRELHKADGWIAATAIHHELTLVTHDADFVFEKPIRGLNVICHAEPESADEVEG
jgi:predicted nucleic acid-binding protein